MNYLGERAGMEFDPELIASFVKMMAQWESRIARIDDETPVQSPNGTQPVATSAAPVESHTPAAMATAVAAGNGVVKAEPGS